MTTERSILGVITARGSSKGILRKNLQPLGGKPLVAWTIEAALASRSIDRLVLSSDDPDIIEVAMSYGCDAPFRRSSDLAQDNSDSVEVVLDAARAVPGHDVLVLLQPTSPLRSAEDIDGAVRVMREAKAPACVSVVETPHHPWLVYHEGPNGRMDPFVDLPAGVSRRRQDLPQAWKLNGAVYVAELDWLARERTFVKGGVTVAWRMPRERSVDIDTFADFDEAERLLRVG